MTKKETEKIIQLLTEIKALLVKDSYPQLSSGTDLIPFDKFQLQRCQKCGVYFKDNHYCVT